MESVKLLSKSAFIDGIFYHVEPYPWKAVEVRGPLVLKKGVAYQYETDLTRGLFPFRGIVDDTFSYNTAKIGIYFKKIGRDRYKKIIIRPETKKDAEEYRLGREKDLIAATMGGEFDLGDFIDSDLAATDAGADIYKPPIRVADDSLNKIVKLMIRLKAAPFEPYGRRLQMLAVDRRPGTERSNTKNNARRGINNNLAMSMNKATEYMDVWQSECAIVIRDKPHAMHPMAIPAGKMLVTYPSGVPFDINTEDLIDISDEIALAINETNSSMSADEDTTEEDQ